MNRTNLTFVAVAVLGMCAVALGEDWMQWRGNGNGVAPGNPPATWDATTARWKVAIPGQGHSSPIIHGDRIYLMTAVKTDREVKPAGGEAPPGREAQSPPERGERQGRGGRRGRRGPPPAPSHVHEFVVMALDRADGSVVWSRKVREEVPHQATHGTNTHASGSPVTDGEHVYAFFGSRGLYCLDLAGNVKWEKDFGDMETRLGFGEGASPALHGDTIVVPWDHEGESFVVALDKKTGDENWRKPRDENTNWAMPVVVEVKGREQVILPATNATIAYDLENGDEIWRCSGMTTSVVPTPVVGHGMVYLMSGFRGNALQAVRLEQADGDISNSGALAWTYDRHTPYIPSPLLSGDRLYFLSGTKGMISCFDAKTGEQHYTAERLDLGSVYASPVAAGGKVYVCDREGHVVVLKDGPALEVVATSSIDEPISATPAIVGDRVYVRGSEHLFCFGPQ